jgi:hypothetical protein
MTVPSNELIDRLRERYETKEPPPCRICGSALSLVSLGRGWQTWKCSSVPFDALMTKEGADHFERSRWERRVGDPDVIELIGLYEDALRTAERQVTLMREVQQR